MYMKLCVVLPTTSNNLDKIYYLDSTLDPKKPFSLLLQFSISLTQTDLRLILVTSKSTFWQQQANRIKKKKTIRYDDITSNANAGTA